MRIDELAPKIYDLLSMMIARQSELEEVPIIEAYDNASRPTPIYLTYTPNLGMRKTGKTTTTPATATEPVCNRQDYEVTVTIREIGGYGQYLQMISQMVDDLSIKVYLYEEMISIMRVENAVPIPRLLDDDRWERESAMEMVLAIAHVVQDNTTYIEYVEFNNNIGE